MIRFLLRLSLLIVLPLAILALLLALATSPTPAVGVGRDLSVADMARGHRLWQDLNPRHLREGQTGQLSLSSQELSLGLNYLAGRLGLLGASAQVEPQGLRLRASAPVPGLSVARYCNLELLLQPDGILLHPASLRLGSLPLPARLSSRLLHWALGLSPLGPQYAVARDMLLTAQLQQDRLHVSFIWQGRALEQSLARGVGLEVEALEAYRRHLAAQTGRDFVPLLAQAFALARERSRQGDPVRENRAALTALAERVFGTRLLSVGGVSRLPRQRSHMRLAGRGDFAQHFALSAFLAATGGAGFSDAAGLYKELLDARQGSGFSFNDLAADRAGSRLGERATRSASRARHVQDVLAEVRDADLFFPQVQDLPEFMSQAEFQRRFGGVDAPAYQAMLHRIEERIATLPLYRD